MTDIAIIVQSCIAAGAYSFVYYAKNRQKKGQPLKFKKMVPTLIVGLAVGVMFAQSGVIPTQTALETKLAAMAGTVALVETLLKVVVNALPDPEDI